MKKGDERRRKDEVIREWRGDGMKKEMRGGGRMRRGNNEKWKRRRRSENKTRSCG